MSVERASVFDAEDATDLDVSDFTPRRSDRERAPLADVRAVSEGARFRSREPEAPVVAETEPAPRREARRYRTGRNMQLNIKARAETIEAFYVIADAQGWVLGETFERAIAALKVELEDRNRKATK